MKQYVLTVMEDVCDANGKDVEATELLQKMKLYGKVETLEDVVAAIRREYQTMLDNLTAHLNAIREQELTEDEIVFLNFYRERKIVLGEAYLARIATLEKQLDEISTGYQKKIAQISALLGAE